mgnify:CR=1
MKHLFSGLIFFGLIFCSFLASAQVISGPMLGPVNLRDASVWVELEPGVKTARLQWSKKGSSVVQYADPAKPLSNRFNTVLFEVGGLEPATTYNYKVIVNGKATTAGGSFTTQDLWQWRKPAPDFSFLTGSCNYVNQPPYDRPGRPYGGDSSIYEPMAREKAAFMLWLGDNWYTREVDYYSRWGLWYRAQHDRKQKILQPFLAAMPQYAIWDDHDFGPNDIGTNYIFKDESREIFKNYWANPSYGEWGKGIYTQINYSDVDLFLLDDRTWRSADALPDSVNGAPNPEKRMVGVQQLQWLKNALRFSNATFKIVAVGSQVLNPASPYDKWKDFPVEYYELTQFLADNKINGVLFLTGDRHHSEVIKVERPGTYPLYDITVSPLTSGTHLFGGPEKNNPWRVVGVDQLQNYGRISVTGKRNERKLTVEFLGIKGNKLAEWSVGEAELKTPGGR